MAYSKQNFQDGQILTAANLEKMENGIIAGQGARNLLVNSDFRIAHAGQNSTYDSLKYVCDKWISWDADATFGDGYITPGSPIDQRVSKRMIDINKTYTAAICFSDGTIRADSGTFANGFGSYPLGIYCMKQGDSYDHVTVRLNTGNNIRWVALYEGSYTIDTLPDYIPKPIQQEMLDCGIPLYPRNLLDNSDFRNPVNQRGKTSYSSGGHTIDRWYFYNPNGDGTVTINNGYISLTGGSGAVSLSCRFPKGFLDANKTYTARICDNLGNINPTSLIFYDSFDSFELSAGAGETKNIVWAALYEGSYDASTLPAYQPKGYAAELAECQRYYENSWFGADKTKNLEMQGVAYKSDALDVSIKYRVPKRIIATVSLYPVEGTDGWRIYKGQAYRNLNSVSVSYKYHDGFILNATKGSDDTTTWVDGQAMLVYGNWEASADL